MKRLLIGHHNRRIVFNGFGDGLGYGNGCGDGYGFGNGSGKGSGDGI